MPSDPVSAARRTVEAVEATELATALGQFVTELAKVESIDRAERIEYATAFLEHLAETWHPHPDTDED